MSVDDLTSLQKMVLRLMIDEPDNKITGPSLIEANYLGSLGLAKYTGSLRWEATKAGR